MTEAIPLPGALGISAGLIYILDSGKGRRRRAMLRDDILKASKAAAGKSPNLKKRFQAKGLETEKVLNWKTPTGKKTNAKGCGLSGRLALPPHTIKTVVENGKVRLGDLIFAGRTAALLNSAASIGGSREIKNKFEKYELAEHLASLQGKPYALPNSRAEHGKMGYRENSGGRAARRLTIK